MVLLSNTEIRERKEGYKKAASMFDEKIDELSENFRKELDIIKNNIKKKENLIKRMEVIINEIYEKNQIDEKRKEYDILNKCKNVMEEDIECNRVMEEKLTSIIADINCMKGVFSKAVANMNFIPGMIDTPIKGVRLFRIFK